MPKFGPEPWFEPRTVELNLQFRFGLVLLCVGSVRGSVDMNFLVSNLFELF